MMGRFGVALAAAVLAMAGVPADGFAQTAASTGVDHPASAYYRGARKPQVRGFVRRGGYYSYTPEDTINSYGNNRTRFGGANSYNDPLQDRQSRFGPLDHGFFFDSGIAPRGGYSPYQN